MALLTLATCLPTDPGLLVAPLGDAGDEAFVRRVIPLVLGRNPTSNREVEVLLQIIDQTDRPTVVRGLASSPEAVERWGQFFLDILNVNRAGERANPACYWLPGGEDPGVELAEWVRDHRASGEPYAQEWTMRDLIRSGLMLDDISVIYRANLFSQLAKDIRLLGLEGELLVRRNLFNIFMETYLQQDLVCLPCHNSEYSVNPELAWAVPTLLEKSVFGDSAGRPQEEMFGFFRKHGLLAGYDIFAPQYDEAATGCYGRREPGCDGCACEEYVCANEPICCTEAWDDSCFTLCGEAGLGCVPGLPEDFDGCDALTGYPGCAGCECEERVLLLSPTCAESWDPGCAEKCRLATPECLLDDPPSYDPEGVTPWGAGTACGIFEPLGSTLEDPVGVESFFVSEAGTDASAWDLEGMLHRGFDKLRGGADMGSSESVDGELAFAWLVSQTIANQVWKEAYGAPLLISHNMSRNVDQRDSLWGATDVFVEGGFSLAELLVFVTESELFNTPPVSQLSPEVTPYAMPRILDPWVDVQENEEERLCSLGDVVHRKNPRVLMRHVSQAMDWPSLPEFPKEGIPEGPAGVVEGLGVFLKDSIKGSTGNDFQGLSTWEFAFGSCSAPVERGDGCTYRLTPGCGGCGCEANVCAALPECCEVRWDAKCASFCGDAPQGCQVPDGYTPVEQPDWIGQLITTVETNGSAESWTLADSVSALKDRLLGDPNLDNEEERADLEALLRHSLDTPVEEVDDLEGTLRWACSVFLATPQFQFAGLPGPSRQGEAPAIEVLGSRFVDYCEVLGEIVLGAGGYSCDAQTITTLN